MEADDTVIGSPAIEGEDLPHNSRWLTMDGTTDDLGAWQVEALAQRKRAEKAEAAMYSLQLAIAGGEDAPGSASLVTPQAVDDMHAEREDTLGHLCHQNRELRELVEKAIALAERGTWLPVTAPHVERLKQRLADIDKEDG